VLIDVGGDVLAQGHEPGLRSPLCDALMLAAGGMRNRLASLARSWNQSSSLDRHGTSRWHP
jgi:hypothetical protein